MKILLAPMEGVVDPVMRDLLTTVGGIDRCVTEFVRVSERVLPSRVFYRLSPELHVGGVTSSGVPVFVQLLGSEPDVMAANALRAATLGAPGIDLNFGCPAKTVNRNRGGSILLKEPDLVNLIVSAVREAVPDNIPVTAKMRLGYEDKALAIDNAVAIADAGASEICVHARTKVEGYRPPAHWSWIAQIRNRVDIPVVANGDVFSTSDYQLCREVSGCENVMVGRGLLQRPDLARGIVAQRDGVSYVPMDWATVVSMLYRFFESVQQQVAAKHAPGRIKQWLSFLQKQYPQAKRLFELIKKEMHIEGVRSVFQQHSCL
ncbi:tRNA-dihydrouridine synthase [Motiliproteus sp. MSK22-1]|uniref:tRNA dihydrouridine synthase n=1 Tax=Motiliproteus sp. MSK22-1 TaxID=1897630 RepID=UPI0009770D2E|nr:tRNA-dihydrouridine synthase [Motiliproteus sp. MSK22-1]OMH25272.1 tRNA dihydrouridine(16) synthase DusC [Motiliproteus sp. MSK22-1]